MRRLHGRQKSWGVGGGEKVDERKGRGERKEEREGRAKEGEGGKEWEERRGEKRMMKGKKGGQNKISW